MDRSVQQNLFSNVGIDAIGFYTPSSYVDLTELAQYRGVDPQKYEMGLMVKEMRIPDVGEDIITMSIKAAQNALLKSNISPNEIDAVFVGTETITYAVKSVSNIIVDILGISPNSITQDIYNACAGATLAVLNAISMIENGIIHKALVIGADISRYDLNSPGEPTQGAGAIAFILTKNPKIACFSRHFGKVSGNVNDFYRNAGSKNAVAFGKYSVESYLNFQMKAFDDLKKNCGHFEADYYVFHAPFSKLPVKFLTKLILERSEHFVEYALNWNKEIPRSRLTPKIPSIRYSLKHFPSVLTSNLLKRGYSRQVISNILSKLSDLKHVFFPHLEIPMHFGNMYSASVWAQIAYILETSAQPNDILYFGSYGSGATCITGLIKTQREINEYQQLSPSISNYLTQKVQRSVSEYEQLRKGNFRPQISLGTVKEWKQNTYGIYLNFCDEGCLIPNIPGLNHCPQGHTGFYRRFFPFYAELESEPIPLEKFSIWKNLKPNQVHIIGPAHKGTILEYNMRRYDLSDEYSNIGLINWIPTYIAKL